MSDEHLGSRLAALLRTLKPKTKEPVSTKVLNTWIAQAEGKLGDEATRREAVDSAGSSRPRWRSPRCSARSTPKAGTCFYSRAAPCFSTD